MGVNDLFDLGGKTALVTGASSGIGLAVAQAFAAAGAKVAVASNDAAGCRSAVEAIGRDGGEAADFPCEVMDPQQLRDLVASVEARFGGIDILVVNAGGIVRPADADAASNSAGFAETLWLNAGQAALLTDLVVAGMAARGGGSIILMASIGGVLGGAYVGSYGMAKAAMAQLARNLAVQWGPRNVRSNAIAPGFTRTPLTAPLFENPAMLEHRMKMTPLRRAGEPHEIAGAAVFLASKAGAFVNGHTLIVDGGSVITDGN
jgi:NAD(P)-dependent dehydrogenase (short-subunit alcohol dehydrogenase family)